MDRTQLDRQVRAARERARGAWWIVETDELGRTATPGELFAQQAREVLQGAPYHVQVKKVRPANPLDPWDLCAIKQSTQELQEVQIDRNRRAGNLR